MLLRQKLAQYGFESNDDYDYHLSCLLNANGKQIRCLNIEGDSQRRKTAFAQALGMAMEFKHQLYHDFTEQNPLEENILPDIKDEKGAKALPITSYDKTVSDACAFSEAEQTLLILDQIQAADFREHIRLFHFLESGVWTIQTGEFYANKRHLFVFMISETPLYHSLQKISFRVWVGRTSDHLIQYQPKDLDLPEKAKPMLLSLEKLFFYLGITPIESEYRRLIDDITLRVCNIEQLKYSIFGWVEGVERSLLYNEEAIPLLSQALTAIQDFQCLDNLELKGIKE